MSSGGSGSLSTLNNNTNSLTEYFKSIPLITLSLLIINVAVHLFVFITSFDISDYTVNPNAIIYNKEYYRIITGTFLHGGILHILMNMMTLVSIGKSVEINFGSLVFYFITCWSLIFSGIFQIILSYCAMKILNDPSMMTNSIGYSGILFSYASISSFHSSELRRSIFGFFEVPTKIYPIILLIILQFFIPNISLFGHLGGLIAGYFFLTPIFSFFFLPSYNLLTKIDNFLLINLNLNAVNYKKITNNNLIHSFFAWMNNYLPSFSINLPSVSLPTVSPMFDRTRQGSYELVSQDNNINDIEEGKNNQN